MNTTSTTGATPLGNLPEGGGRFKLLRKLLPGTLLEQGADLEPGKSWREGIFAKTALWGVSMALAAGAAYAADSTNAAAWPPVKKAPAGAPNVVLVLLDDTGYGFSSTFGGPVPTPNFDQLASQGLRYNNFHVNAMCSPTRAALLSGRNSHQVAFGRIAESANPAPGYTSVWPKNAVPLAEVLKRNGYSTAAFGKWHNTPVWEVNPAGPFDHWPTSLGFENFYGFLGAATSQYEPVLFHKTDPVDLGKTPEQGYLLNPDLVSQAEKWLHQHDASASDRPFFLYFATGAIHTPHQVPREWIAKFKGKFDDGWDKQREDTFARQKARGIIPQSAEYTPRPAELPSWDSISADEKKIYAAQAEVYAAYLAETDYELGRLFDDIHASGHTNDTIFFLIIGDNGASAEGGLDPKVGGPNATVPEQLARLGELGSKDLTTHVQSGWAWAANTPFKWAKRTASHLGGTTDPLIVSWPGHVPADGSVRSQFSFVTDIAPTIYELAHIEFPQEVDGVKQLPLEGSSLVASFTDPQVTSQHTHQYFEMLGSRGIYKDGWWAGSRKGLPWGFGGDVEPGKWELYDLTQDFTQAHDLADQNPGKLKELEDFFASEAQRNQVYPVEDGGSGFAFGGGRGARGDAADGANKRTTWTYHGGAERISGQYAPRVAGNSHTITAEVDSGGETPNGVIFAQGSRTGGVVLFVKDGKVVFEGTGRAGAVHTQIAASEPLPAGKSEIKIIATKIKSADGAEQTTPPGDGRGRGFGGGNINSSFNIALLINGKPVANGEFKNVAYGGGFGGGGGLSIGSNKGTAVSRDYTGTNPFNGEVSEVTFAATPIEAGDTP
jgi:arylsulfatase